MNTIRKGSGAAGQRALRRRCLFDSEINLLLISPPLSRRLSPHLLNPPVGFPVAAAVNRRGRSPGVWRRGEPPISQAGFSVALGGITGHSGGFTRITKVLTGADYSNKSCGPRGGVTQRTGMQKGLPEVQQGPGPEPCPEDG
ncbi:hypothetical protein EYF80_038650 [Liparis tanakae]|uniref:Uncharacterized protein n=1 Tax=Liparis tanakae TaxID=230148 RepID=A0A4Z2GCM7_9TELE|nr:hypothetical protein EYF80_038650 [Liparis tanakae]